ncbi:MAG: UDP-N-acetylglucosamine 1-carboxyvinyltransferase [Planctomycetes bacterium]|nr:UDP-N-acetylglucosamine 1-carboxyvinyltransferase [Planctomycetota bacterium]MCB9888885.1 UDP-N-acetylglucosamine 1-carboxyvinyltransferase [Planctomycetota bacterium]
MDRIRIKGGRELRGQVRISGSKNSALPILAASLLVDGPVVLRNIPQLKDVDNMCRILRRLGARVQRTDSGALEIEAIDKTVYRAPYDLVRTMRASFVVLGPLWARRGVGQVSYPGGCVFGHRPVDLHLKGLEEIGARIDYLDGYVTLSGPVQGGTVFLGGPFGSTVLGTANVLMAATLAKGTTYIEFAAQEPEIADLCAFLNACGARISGIGSHLLVVEGVESLRGCDWTVIPDRIEAATFLTGAVMTNSDVTVTDVDPAHMLAVIDRLRATGAQLELGTDRVRNVPRADPRIRAADVTTLPYPGFPTDIQAQYMALMAMASGVSVITEKVYPERFMHAAELVRLGARIRREGSSAIVEGTDRLAGAPVMASDLRASASLVLMGLVAAGQTDVQRVYHIDRGYELIETKLRGLGADIERIREG